MTQFSLVLINLKLWREDYISDQSRIGEAFIKRNIRWKKLVNQIKINLGNKNVQQIPNSTFLQIPQLLSRQKINKPSIICIKKAVCITVRLTAIRLYENLRLNINLFQIIRSNFQLATVDFLYSNKTKRYIFWICSQLRSLEQNFALLPKTLNRRIIMLNQLKEQLYNFFLDPTKIKSFKKYEYLGTHNKFLDKRCKQHKLHQDLNIFKFSMDQESVAKIAQFINEMETKTVKRKNRHQNKKINYKNTKQLKKLEKTQMKHLHIFLHNFYKVF